MSFFLKITYYALLACTGLAGFFYLGASILGLIDRISNAKTREDFILIVACLVCLSILYKAYQVGHIQQHWGMGLAFVLGAILALVVIFVGGMLMFGKIHWQ